jgi:FlaG/FlaF family flagellin (archaellin)
MPGGVLMAIVMVLVIPIGVMLVGAVYSAILGYFLDVPPEATQTAEVRE